MDVKPDLVLFPDEDELFSQDIEEDLVLFWNGDKKYMMFEYATPLPSIDGRVVNNGKPYPRKPHMKAFKWMPNLTYYPYPTLARLSRSTYSGEDAYRSRAKILHFCYYTKDMERTHLDTTNKKMYASRK